MSQIHILHAASATAFAELLAEGLEREGYSTTWDGQHGAVAAMSGKTLERAEQAVCVPVWTRGILSAKWTREAAQSALARDALVEIILDPVISPIEEAVLPPFDFSEWDEVFAGDLWKSFIARVHIAAGRPTGKRIPLKEEAPPAVMMTALGLAVIAGVAAGGLPSGHFRSESLAGLEQVKTEPIATGATSMGGPALGVHEPATAHSLSAPATAHFDRLEPAPVTKIVPLEDFNAAQPTELASADPAKSDADTHPDHPVL